MSETAGGFGDTEGSPALHRLIAAERAAWQAGESAIVWRAELIRASDAAMTEPTLDEFLARALNAVRELLFADTVSFLAANEEGDELIARRSVGVPERTREGVRIPAGRGMAGLVIATKSPLVVPDLSQIELASPMLREVGVRSVVAVPVLASERVVGVLHAGSFHTEAFGERDVTVLTIVADRLGAAMERVKLFESEREARNRVELFARRLGHLQHLTAKLSPDLSAAEVADVVCRETGVFFGEGIADCGMWQLEDTELVLVGQIAQPGDDAAPPSAGRPVVPSPTVAPFSTVPLDAAMPVSEAARTRLPIWIAAVEEMYERYPELAGVPTTQRRFALMPLYTAAETLGVLALGFEEEGPFDEAEKDFLVALAGQAAQAFERARLRELEQIVSHHNRFLARVSSTLAESLDFEETLSRVVHLVVPEMADLATLHVFDERTDPTRMTRVALAHRDEGVEQAVRDASPSGEDGLSSVLLAANLNEVFHMEDIETALDLAPAELREGALKSLAPLNLGSVLLVPLAHRGTRLGVLSVAQLAGGDRHFDELSQQLLSDVGQRAAVALANARLHSDLGESQRAEGFLLDVATALAGASDFRETLERLAATAVTALGELCLIDLVDEDGRLQRMVAHHVDPRMQPLVDQLRGLGPEAKGDHPSAVVVRTGTTMWSPDMPDEFLASTTRTDKHLGIVRRLEFTSYIAVPLTVGRSVLGSLTLVASRSGRHFGPEDVVLAERLATHVGSVVEKARRYEFEHHTSQVLQASLLPSTLPVVTGLQLSARYLPGTREAEVGGDFYDAVVLPGGPVVLVIGDVAGHDHRAAATMGHLRSAIRALSARSAGPAEVVGAIAESWDLLGFDRLATGIVAHLDTDSGGITMVSAGHPPPLLVSDGGAEFLPVHPSPPFGAPCSPLKEWHGSLRPNEVLVFYTDGVIDDRNHDLEARMRQLARVARTAPRDVNGVCDRIVAALGEDRSDDVALLAASLVP